MIARDRLIPFPSWDGVEDPDESFPELMTKLTGVYIMTNGTDAVRRQVYRWERRWRGQLPPFHQALFDQWKNERGYE